MAKGGKAGQHVIKVAGRPPKMFRIVVAKRLFDDKTEGAEEGMPVGESADADVFYVARCIVSCVAGDSWRTYGILAEQEPQAVPPPRQIRGCHNQDSFWAEASRQRSNQVFRVEQMLDDVQGESHID